MKVKIKHIIVIFFMSFFSWSCLSWADDAWQEGIVPPIEQPQIDEIWPVESISANTWVDSGSWMIDSLQDTLWIEQSTVVVPEETSSWQIEQPNENQIIPPPPSIDIIYTLQSPSYIVSNWENSYMCDPAKTECKVNLDMRQTFWGYVPAKYACLIDFSFTTGEENNCNPNTVIFPKWEYDVKMRIYEKENPDVFWEKTIHISNPEIVKIVPSPIITVQSWLEVRWENDFVCKTEECSTNLTAENSFSWEYIESYYECRWDFWSGSYDTEWTDKKCNPGYVKFWYWIHSLSLRLNEKWNSENFKETYFSILNTFSPASEITIIGDDEISWTWEVETENQGTGTLIPEIIITLQSPSYVTETNIDEYLCDWSKDECKVNFDLSDTFGGYVPSKYACIIDFSFTTGEEEKCNPNTVIFPVWEGKIHFLIYEKENLLNFTEKWITIKNEEKQIVETTSKWWWGWSSNSSNQEEIREIIVQSGLEKDAFWNYFCEEEECRINLTFQKKWDEECLWDFSLLTYKEKYQYTCNPWILYARSWTHKIELRVGEKLFELTFSNKYLENKKLSNNSPISVITLQGTLSKNKSLHWNELTCFDTDECHLNFTADKSYDVDSNNLLYEWDFWNGEVFSWKNPKTVSFSPWKYKIILRVFDEFSSSIDIFFVEVLKKWQIESELVDKNIQKYLKITAVKPNPVGVDTDEWIEIKNHSIYYLHLKWLIISKWNKKFEIEEDVVLPPFWKKKFYKYETSLSLWNKEGEVLLYYNTLLIDSLSWNFLVPDNYIITKEKQEITSQKVKVIDVIDGDTLLVQFEDGTNEKLRLIWVDTPETKHPKKQVEFFWKEASNFTKTQLSGKDVYLEIDKQNYRDKYMRLLWYIYTEENGERVSFNKLLIEKGYAMAYLVFPFKYSVEYKKAELQAKKEKIWIWSDKEMVKEINILKKEEKDELVVNEIFKEEMSYIDYIDAFFEEHASLFEKIYSPAKTFEEMYAYIKANWEDPTDEVIADISFSREEREVYQKSFYQKVSFLKSGIKFSWKTEPNSLVKIAYWENTFLTNSDENGIFSYLQKENVVVWNFLVSYSIVLKEGISEIQVLQNKELTIKKDFVSSFQEYLVKTEQKKLEKSQKIKKVKKKKVKTKKLPKVKPLVVDVKEIIENDFSNKKENKINIYIYFFILVFWVSFWYYFLNKEEKIL